MRHLEIYLFTITLRSQLLGYEIRRRPDPQWTPIASKVAVSKRFIICVIMLVRLINREI